MAIIGRAVAVHSRANKGVRGAPATWATSRAANGVAASTTSSRPRRDQARTVRANVARMASGHKASSRDVTSRGWNPSTPLTAVPARPSTERPAPGAPEVAYSRGGSTVGGPQPSR